MSQVNKLAPHEVLELREMLSSDVLGSKKIQSGMAMVSDPELKSFMERCLDSKKNKISSIHGFIENNQM